MRKLTIAIILIIAGSCASAQDSLTHKSVLMYRLKDYNVIMVSQSITDSLLTQPGAHTQSPPKERVVFVHGDLLHIYLTPNKKPFFKPVTQIVVDENTKNGEKVPVQDLEIRRGIIEYNQYTDWKNIQSFPLLNKDSPLSLFPLVPGKLPVTKGDYYSLFGSVVLTYSTRVISIRNKNTKEEIINFRFRIFDEPTLPFLTHFTQDESDKKLIDSFNKVRAGLVRLPDLNDTVGAKAASEAPDASMILRNENLYETAGLVLWFRKQRHNYPDSSLEYRLLSEANKDTAWIKTGHRFELSHFVAGNHYKLQVRYELHPGYIQEHTFYVVPRWYQTTQTKIIFAALLIMAALLTWLLIYYRLLNKSKRRKEQLSLEIRSIRSQLNPHFIFNAMSSIQGLINKNDIPAANSYLTEFSTLLRKTLHNSDKEMVPLITEINLLETYLKLEQLRFKFRYEIDIDQAINKNATEIPNLILQPLVENAVKHGVSPLGDKGLIKIDVTKREHDLLILITDNGNKFDDTRSTDGFGLKLTKNRISLLSQTIKEQPIKFTIGRSQDSQTIVHLEFTNWV